jgi:hypothetical protein
MPDLVPVEGDPFGLDFGVPSYPASGLLQYTPPPAVTLQPVDYDPFSAEQMGNEAVANTVGKVVSGLASQLWNLPRDVQGASEQLRQTAAQGAPQYDPGPAFNAALMTMGGGAAGVPMEAGEAALGAGPIRAYHGSPHDFDKFDMSKIGTGEGAQAYGRGLYFAENERVARQYRDDLTAMQKSAAQRALDQAGGDVDSAIANVRGEIDRLNNLPNAGGDPVRRDRLVQMNEEKLAQLNAVKNTGELSPGKMYEVSINADPSHFLDWDKPLSEQSPQVQQALLKVMGNRQPLGSPTYGAQALRERAPTEVLGEIGKGHLPVQGQSATEPGLPQGLRAKDFIDEIESRLQLAGYHTFRPPNPNSLSQYLSVGAQSPFNEGVDAVGGVRVRAADHEGYGADFDYRPSAGGYYRVDPDQAANAIISKLQKNGVSATPLSGSDLYGRLGGDASKSLRQAGIPGIKYQSLQAGQPKGTYNYVVFDHNIIDILKKYGLAGLIAGGAAHFRHPAPQDNSPKTLTPIPYDPFGS